MILLYLVVRSRRTVIIVLAVLAHSAVALTLTQPGFDHSGAAAACIVPGADGAARFLVIEDVVGPEAAEIIEGHTAPLGLVVVPLLAAFVFAPVRWNWSEEYYCLHRSPIN